MQEPWLEALSRTMKKGWLGPRRCSVVLLLSARHHQNNHHHHPNRHHHNNRLRHLLF
jgi:hypothetical protein